MSKLTRAKSFVFTKVLESKYTRQKLLTLFLGEKGQDLSSNMQAVLTMKYSKAVSEKVMRYLLRYCVRVMLLHDDRSISQKDLIHLSAPLHNLTLSFREMLHAAERKDAEGVDAMVLHRLAQTFCAALTKCLTRVLTENKDPAKFQWLIDTVTSHELIDYYLSNPETQKQRRGVSEALDVILAPFLDERRPNQCKYGSCHLEFVDVKTLGPEGVGFHGLGFCVKHHYKMYQNLVYKPSFMFFLEQDPDYTPFTQFMNNHLPANYLEFYRGAGNYAQAKWGVRGVFANMVWEKYFDAKATHPVKLTAEINNRIVTKLKNYPPSIDAFKEARDFVSQAMNNIFLSRYTTSEECKAYVKAIKLPDSVTFPFRKHTVHT
jgi:hypothetical protein